MLATGQCIAGNNCLVDYSEFKVAVINRFHLEMYQLPDVSMWNVISTSHYLDLGRELCERAFSRLRSESTKLIGLRSIAVAVTRYLSGGLVIGS